MANAFKNDGSFMEQFLKKQQGFPPSNPIPFEQPATQPDYGNHYGAFPNNAPVLPPQNQFFNPAPFPPQNNFAPMNQNFGGFPPRAPTVINRNDQPSRSVWLGNIHPETTEAEIRQEFSMFGMIESVKILPHKNCAFVNFMDLNDAINAHTHAFGKVIRGNELRAGWGKVDNTVEEQRSVAVRPEKFAPCKNLWVGNLSEGMSEEELRHEFEVYGRIERVRLLPQKNCAFVNFSTVDEALAARNNLQGKSFYDRQIRINFGRFEKDDEKMFMAEQPISAPRPEINYDTPPFTAPPEDLELRERISATVGMIVRRKLKVPAFEAYVKAKEKDNPKLSFMFNGPGYDYYRWKLYCLKFNLPENQPPPRPFPGYHNNAGLPFNDRLEFDSILENLTGYRESIKQSKIWIAERTAYSHEIVDMIEKKIKDPSSSTDKQLHIVYLINDVLYHCLKMRSEPSVIDTMSSAFLEKMSSILSAVYPKAAPDNQVKITKILNLWAEKSIFPRDVLANIEKNMQYEDTPISAPPMEDELPPWLQNQPAPLPPHPGSFFPVQPQFNPMAGEELMASVNEFYNDLSVGNKRGRSPPEDGYTKRKQY